MQKASEDKLREVARRLIEGASGSDRIREVYELYSAEVFAHYFDALDDEPDWGAWGTEMVNLFFQEALNCAKWQRPLS